MHAVSQRQVVICKTIMYTCNLHACQSGPICAKNCSLKNNFNNNVMPTITLNSVQYHFLSEGLDHAEQPALVLLHGSGGDSSVWQYQMEVLADRRPVIAVDLPGHGQSQGSLMHTMEAYADWLKLMIDALNLNTFVLAGHSLGGSIAQQFARTFPEVLKGLVLVGTGMHFTIPPEYLDMLHQDFAAACLISCRQAFAAHIPSNMLEHGLAMLHRNGPEVLLHDLSLCGCFDSTAWAQNLAMPCLIICGKQDAITPSALSHALAITITASTLKLINESGHMVMQEQPDLFNKEISLFIENTCRV
jgi:pimeloyl-ACP methyl ester carboxylesterase